MLKKLIAATAALLMIGAAPAMAQKAAYYDHGKVVSQSKAWQSIQTQLQAKGAEISAQLKPLADEVSAEGKALEQTVGNKKPDQLSDSETKRIGQLQQKMNALQASQQRVNQEFSLVRELAEAKINSAIQDSLEDVAKAKRVDVIQRKGSLGYVNSRYDVTSEVLASVDRQLSTLSVEALIAEVAPQQQAAN